MLTFAGLLRYHDNARRPGGSPDPGNGEELHEEGKNVALYADTRLLNKGLLLEQTVDVVDVSGGLERRVPEPQQRILSVCVLVLLETPSKALRAEEGADDEKYGRDEGRGELQSPGNLARFADGQVGASPGKDACRPTGGKLAPGLGDGHAKEGQPGEDGGNKDDASAAKPVVQRVGMQPALAAAGQYEWHDERQPRHVQEALSKPMIQLFLAQSPALATGRVGDAEGEGEAQVGSV